MAHLPSLRWWRHALALAALALPATAAAQVSPTTPAHPNLPWGIGVATPQGQLIRYIYVPPQPVTLQYLVPGAPESTPPATEPAPPAAQPAPPAAQPAPPTAQPAPPTGQPAPSTSQPTPPSQPPPPAAPPAPPSAAGDAKPPEDTAAGESVPATPQVVYQQVTVPGYYVRETTVGFHYPDRWMIEQVGPNTYRWRPLPAQFVPR
jgi:hypothetical protein